MSRPPLPHPAPPTCLSLTLVLVQLCPACFVHPPTYFLMLLLWICVSCVLSSALNVVPGSRYPLGRRWSVPTGNPALASSRQKNSPAGFSKRTFPIWALCFPILFVPCPAFGLKLLILIPACAPLFPCFQQQKWQLIFHIIRNTLYFHLLAALRYPPTFRGTI